MEHLDFKMCDITISRLRCLRCGYSWYPRPQKDGTIVMPTVCPNSKCKSPYWDKMRKGESKD